MDKVFVQSSALAKSGLPFPIVAIGSSDVAMSKMSELLQNISPELGMAYVYVYHSNPNADNIVKILQNCTSMRVLEAANLQSIEQNTLYVLPAGKQMNFLDNGLMELAGRPTKYFQQMPINHIFVSIAEKQKEGTIGVLLSGNDVDGAVGLKAIKHAGGITIVQNETAMYQDMPGYAKEDGLVDLVLSVGEIAKELERIANQKEDLKILVNSENEDESDETNEPEDKQGDKKFDEHIKAIITLIKKSTGIDFTHYKKNTIHRRITRRRLLYKFATLPDYLQYIEQHKNEVNLLYEDLLIHVTSFFRDPDVVDYLKKTIMPRIFINKASNDPIRIWVPACSTGEEAFSLAMICIEIMGEKSASSVVQIFATDLSKQSVDKARLGTYNAEELLNISPQRMKQFFNKVDGSYRIIKPVRDLCVFAQHNLFKDPPFSRLDLISCCNLMIYLDRTLQSKVLASFHYSLNEKAYLVLGKSETINKYSQIYFQLDQRYSIYEKKNGVDSRAIFELIKPIAEDRIPAERSISISAKKTFIRVTDIEKQVDDLLFSKYVPASVLVNENLDILQFRGSTGLFLEPSPGKASLNLLKMARDGLVLEIRNLVHKANKLNEIARQPGLEFKINGIMHEVAIEVIPINSGLSEEKLYLVIFKEIARSLVFERKSNQFSKDKVVKQLESALREVRDDMKSIVEDMETNNEELQSANEEIISTNEELQSLNEELQTSKEELESSNEELMTINSELQMRNEQLAEAYEYSEMVSGVIHEAVILLDKNLRVKSANKSFYNIFKVNETETEGKLIYDLGNRQWNIPMLRELLEKIIPENSHFEGVQIEHHFENIGKKTMLINAKRISQKTHNQELIFIAIEEAR